MLINSANLMGQGTEPLAFRGFGRIHLEAGMPLAGDGAMTLYVQDSFTLESNQMLQTFFEVNVEEGLELRATISWNDPAATSFSSKQLVNDLDLRGERSYTCTRARCRGLLELSKSNARLFLILFQALCLCCVSCWCAGVSE